MFAEFEERVKEHGRARAIYKSVVWCLWACSTWERDRGRLLSYGLFY
jgi:hypothetical protein